MKQSCNHLSADLFVSSANHNLCHNRFLNPPLNESPARICQNWTPQKVFIHRDANLWLGKKPFSELCHENKETIEPTVRSVCSNGLFIQAQQQLRHLSQVLAVSQDSSNMEMVKTSTLKVSVSRAQSGCEQKTSLINLCKYEHSLKVIWAMKLTVRQCCISSSQKHTFFPL